MERETIGQSLVRIRTKIKYCEFGTLENEMILEQIIEGCTSQELKRKLVNQE